MRTYDPATFLAARAAWVIGGYDMDLWGPFRQAAAERGFCYPPCGTVHDSRDDPEPSQRCIVFAAIRETPRALLAIIGQSGSWSQVVAQLIADPAGQRKEGAA